MRNQRNYLDAASLKDAIRPDAFYLQEQSLLRFAYRSGGWATAGICPFHDDRKAGSFKIHLETGAFKCWSCGAHGGDIIAFVQQRNGLTFIEALRKLSQEWGVQ